MSKPRLRMGEMALPEDPETVEQFEALLAYLKQNVYKGATPSGG